MVVLVLVRQGIQEHERRAIYEETESTSKENEKRKRKPSRNAGVQIQVNNERAGAERDGERNIQVQDEGNKNLASRGHRP